ncbi:MAG: protease inhibitor I42 family protein [Acidimicrobiia bacterium]|jgi:inhibitor of cysteine peptidase
MRSAIAVMVLLFGMSACGTDTAGTHATSAGAETTTAPSQTYVLTMDDTGIDLEVTVGDVVEITLEGNPSTGYGWEVDLVDTAVLAPAGEPAFVTDSDLVGAPGAFTFTFDAVAAGSTGLELVERRPWEPEAAPLDAFGATITVVG